MKHCQSPEKVVRHFIGVIIFCLLAVQLVAGEISFGPLRQARFTGHVEQKRMLYLRAIGPSVLTDATILSRVGGVLLQSTASPSLGFTVERFSLTLRAGPDNGDKLVVSINGRDSVCRLHGWELRPITELADSDNTAFISASGVPSEREAGTYGSRIFRVMSYHPALYGNLLGLRLVQADLVRNPGIASQSDLPYQNDQLILAPGETLGSRVKVAKGNEAVSELLPVMRMAGALLLTDIGVDFTFEQTAQGIMFRGKPYFYLWNEDPRDAKRAIPNNRVNELVSDKWDSFLEYNPVVFSAVEKTAHYVALFRYYKKTQPAAWKSFVELVRNDLSLKDFAVDSPTIIARITK